MAEEGRPLLYNLMDNIQIITDGRHGLNDGDLVEHSNESDNVSKRSDKSVSNNIPSLGGDHT
jgi:hypothetical protein